MKTLLAYELKKLLNRKILWVALALAVGMWVQVRAIGIVNERLSGSVQAERDILGQYEGEVITEALQARLQQDMERYIAAHPDSFFLMQIDENDPDSKEEYWPNEAATRYESSAWVTYYNLIGSRSLEDQQEYVRYAQQRLDDGTTEQGKPLTYQDKRRYQEIVQEGAIPSVIHYARGWEEFFQGIDENGFMAIVVIGLALLGLFNGEASARMEAILLTAKARRRAVAAKLLAATLVATGVAALFFGLRFAAVAFAWGLDGAMLPVSAMNTHYGAGTMPILPAFALSSLALALAAVACGAIVAWVSARFRHGLLTLLVGGGILTAMALVWDFRPQLFKPIYGTLAFDWIHKFMSALPLTVLRDTYDLAELICQPSLLILLLAVPAALTVLLYWLAQRAVLRRRKV